MLAGRAYLLAGRMEEGMRDLEQGIHAAARFGQLSRLAGAAPRIEAELRALGLGQQADAFLAALQAAYPNPLPAGPSSAKPSIHLPPKCPFCGGTIHPGEADWVDDRSIACDYCGSVVPATEA